MKFYVDITLIPNEEDNLGFVWSKVYTQMHLALVEIKDKDESVDVGLSFINYNNHDFPLGDTLRIFANSTERLEALNISKWLSGLDMYIYTGTIKEVPSEIKSYVTFSRKRFKSTAEIRRLAKRYAERSDISEEEALSKITLAEQEYTKLKEKNNLPYINIKSTSTKQFLKIFIEKTDIPKEQIGKFNTFGLSNTSTVPWF